jgi:MFS family permease
MEKNPFNICTFNPDSNCNECKNQDKLDCKLDKNQQKVSMLVVFSSLVIGVFGLIITGLIISNWWILTFYIVFIILFFFVIEIRITCSHCPYYAQKSKHLDCPGNNIFLKIWKFHPEPMNRYEKVGSTMGFVLIGAIPILSQLYSVWFFLSNNPNTSLILVFGLIGVLLATILSFLMFYSLYLLTFCSRCINFSCLFNKVPQYLIDEYLKRNPVIKEAWKKSKITKGKG